MGGFLGAVLDPAGVFSGLADQGSPYQQPDTTPSTWNGPKGFMGGMIGDTIQGINDYNAAKNPPLQLDLSKMEPAPLVAPFQAQWQYSAGKGPQWTEPVHNGYDTEKVRQGDITYNKDTDKGWSSQVSTGPSKGNRF